MTVDELVEVAKKKGLVRWKNTGTIEWLKLNKRQQGKRVVLLAAGRFTKIHYLCTVLAPPTSILKKLEPFECEVVTLDDPRVGTKEEQREAARKTKWFKEPNPEGSKKRKKKSAPKSAEPAA
jgi:hypothetical protein